MAKKPVLTDITNILNGASTINANNDAIETAFDNTLSRDGSSPNQMSADLDMNSNDLLNAAEVHANTLYIGGNLVTTGSPVPSFIGAWATATSYTANNMVSENGNSYICLVDHTSGVFATDLGAGKWSLIAQGFGTGNVTITGTLDVQGQTTVTTGGLDISGTALFNDAVDLDGNLLLDGIGNLSTVQDDLEITRNTVETKVANYSVVAADRGKLIRATTAITLSLGAAATLGDGFYIEVKADGGAITIDPNGSETLDGSATSRVLADGRSIKLHCDGTSWYATSDYSGLATRTIYTSGSGTYTVPLGCKHLRVKGISGGGGGGGVDGQGSSTAGMGGSGQAGGEAEKWIENPSASYTYSVGANGVGGAAGQNAGTNGGDTTFTDGGSTNIDIPGGDGGPGDKGISGSGSTPGGSSSLTPTGGDINIRGQNGMGGAWDTTQSIWRLPKGGSSSMGKGNGTSSANSSGVDGYGYGSGGSGATSRNDATNRAGGDGTGGILIIEEYY